MRVKEPRKAGQRVFFLALPECREALLRFCAQRQQKKRKIHEVASRDKARYLGAGCAASRKLLCREGLLHSPQRRSWRGSCWCQVVHTCLQAITGM
jgi:hypothetical protein